MNNHQVTIKIEGMGCRSCVAKIENKLASLDGVVSKVDFANKTAAVTFIEGGATREDILRTIQDMGYQASIK